uniref:VWFD domain-containing protein n=1 Tax=Junco hyemalis TaxID=40217 RepID=A0A8C5JAG7_JUNHY
SGSFWVTAQAMALALSLRGTSSNPAVKQIYIPANPAHNGRVCSTWGNFHFKTFDGDIFTFPGLCNYVFASHCNAPYEDFNIQIRREVVANTPTINRITMKLEGVVADQSGITIEKSSIYVKVGSKIGVVLLWNEKDSILLELNEKYANQTCGLCGDFNGFPIYNEFISNSKSLQFGNLQKMDGPTEHCEDATSIPTYNCSDDLDDICEKTLTSSAFADCNDLVDVKDYIKACQDDLCSSEESKNSSCICDTIAEYSRQCAHAGGQPLDWRTSKLCPKTCPYNMQYQECNSPCTDTCTNPERSLFCEEHCIDGCFCPPGTVFDDINNSGCIPQQECSCIYNGKTYATGASFSEPCQTCTCNGGQWSCQDKSCPGTCSVVGGSHISTYDTKHYDHHGDCTYVLSKDCTDEKFTILAELRKCGLTDTETCLKSVTLNMNKGQTVRMQNKPSSFFMIMDTSFGVQVEVQFTPVMQVFVRLDASFKNQTCGLCGNFNNIQTDDFKVISGIIEGTASAFANTWKTQASCPNIQQSFENPCALSIDNEKYAQHWCGLLTDSTGPFAACHYAVNPAVYHTNCMFDTCNCENSEDCLCAALSAYVRACAAKGIQLQGWRTDVCTKYTTSCPKSLSYSYTISSCQPTCRSLSEPDVTCNIKFVPVDGCTCVNGTYMDESGKCVPANECPCYYKGSPIPFGEVVHENGRPCATSFLPLVCESPMVYFDCKNNTAGTTGAECQKSCQTLDMQCYSSQCTSGCICPDGLVLDGHGGCIPEEECPCIHNEAMYQPGEKIDFDCNTCVCKNRKWECTKDQCLGTCAVYGDGHYNTFDDKRFSFNGNCEYTLVQDHCGKSGTVNGTFRVATENVPCGNTGTTCSKSIKVFLEVRRFWQNDEVPYTVRYMGMYLVIETKSGLILMWDKKTSIFIKLSPRFKGQVCGLCGNYDGNSVNDFTTRSQSVVENVLEFGNSWKVSSTCPDAASVKDPCSTNPYRKSWSEKQCSIINSNVFAACHSQVEPAKYYQACVTDACACDTGGDCDCFCTAVAAYAQACSEVGVCVAWRSPTICPLFCDYYNQQGECEWHYKPCGASCMKTCKNPSGKCLNDLPGLEGCYPNCPPDKPYFHEDQMKCVSLCDCYDDEDGKIYQEPTPATSTASTSRTTERSTTRASATSAPGETSTAAIQATTSPTTPSEVKIRTTTPSEVKLTTTTGTTAGPSTTTTTPPTTTGPTPATTTIRISNSTDNCVVEHCAWTQWFNVDSPTPGSENGDSETFENIRAAGYELCDKPQDIKCRAKDYPDSIVKIMEQKFECSLDRGLVCRNKDQTLKYPTCFDYEVSVLCCDRKPCQTTVPTAATTVSTSTTHIPAETTTITTRPAATPTAVPTLPQQVITTTVGTTSTLSPQGTTIITPIYTEPMKIKTTTGTTAVPSTTGSAGQETTIISTTTSTSNPQTEGTTTIIPTTTTVPSPATSTASTSRTTERSTTRASATSAPGETSTLATQATTSPTTPSEVKIRTTTPSEVKITTTTGTTAGPSTTASGGEDTTIITTTTSPSSTSPEIRLITTSGPSSVLTTTLPHSGITTGNIL